MVAALRKTLGLSQKEFASLLKVSAAIVNNWEKNKGSLKLHEKNRKALNEVNNCAR
jgi:DNA-binding transcriptional regulator YiaG